MSNLMEDTIASEFFPVDASEIPFPTTEHGAETLAKNGISTTNLPQLVSLIPGFLVAINSIIQFLRMHGDLASWSKVKVSHV